MPPERIERKLAAILAADVAGYSRLMGADEEGTLARLKACRRELMDPEIAEHRGRVVKTTGDGILIEFPSVVDAVRCAMDVQRGMAERNANVTDEQRIEFRVGINLGDIMIEAEDIHGDGVNIAARLESIAEPGGICISDSSYQQVRDKFTIPFEDMGLQQLKNIARPVRVYRVLIGRSAPRERPALALPDKPSIAVLPFQNMSGDPEQEYFADGMVEDIITEMSRIRWLFVIARNSTFTYKGHAVAVKQVARELGVRYVLEGSVRKGGNRVRVTAQMIDATSGAHIWAERYDRDLSDIFAVRDEITASVAGDIEPALAEAEQQRVLRKPPERLDAWEAYQRGLWHFNKYRPEENQTAQTFFRQAIALDPNFAPGHYGNALALQWGIWHFSSRPFLEVQETAREEAQIAVSLDDKDAMAHAVLAHMMMWGGQWEAAIAEARTAVALNPNSAFVISMLGCVLGFGGYREEALERLQQAMRASPHDPLIWLWSIWRALLQFFSRDFVAALQTLRQVVRLRPSYAPPFEYVAASLAYLGQLDEAREALERVPPQSAEQLRRWQQRPPWMRPEDYALRVEGVHLAAGVRG
ncbi:adenylate/guanylate cyclase domain-containing protein [Bradyrhizobium sp. KBS0727]|uniref:adenylate/guanylate cyclase domain-containing protein n=1 Tax=unclassified Bradyrhizobium TaxID=2631580 RepID=UPI00110E39AE|nr:MULTISPECIES: adenylate/guanylate cyclase domain-containing protein [unclassified Bradyrhizobium]QDW37829.1 adenylate/guanylate cyclase domain-containing protein [Bradyrhizobium sp. KBS0725]QDW44433.1 adenylate/guanylate cyclase domain-containing protein [Bradyrhizobium sp. KBS0727]